MANPFRSALDLVTGQYLSHRQAQRSDRELKFTPADPTVNWTYVQHLVDTANTYPFQGDGTGDGNSAVYACLLALALGSVEPPLIVVKKDVAHGGELEPQPDHQLQGFLDEPNDELDMLELRFWIAWAKHSDGNAYLIKVRTGDPRVGLPISLWPVSPTRMEPKTARDSSRLIDYYEYHAYDDGPAEQIPVENVIHFKLGVDPRDPRKGLSGLKRLLREVGSDAEATKFMDALLKNFGVPGMVATLPSDTILNPDQIREMKSRFVEDFSGYGRGKFGVLSGGAKLEQMGFDPSQMNMKALHDFPETRIAAVMGVDPLVARLGVGLEQTSNYASARQVRENFTELTLGPNWKLDAAKWNRKLRPDFTNDKTILVVHDLTEVRALQEDDNAKADRIKGLFTAGIIPQQIAAKELGYDPEWEDGSLFYVPNTAKFIAAKNLETDPTLAPAPVAPAPGQPPQNAPTAAAPAAPAPRAAKDVDAFGAIVQAVVDQAVPAFAEDLQRLQTNQKKRLQRALLSRDKPVEISR